MWYLIWVQENDRFGSTSSWKDVDFKNFKTAPKLLVNPNTHHEVNINSNKPKSEDFFEVISSAGKVKSEFVKEPDFSHIGEHTATIRLWDEYGEETPSDENHNKTFDVKFNVVDKDSWETEDLRGWKFTGDWKRVKNSNHSLTGDYSIYSPKTIIAHKQYNFQKGATYRFTAFVKPETLNDENDTVSLSLLSNGTNPEKQFFLSYVSQLPSEDKGFKKTCGEFTIEDGQENSNLKFLFSSDSGVYIDSFKLERIK